MTTVISVENLSKTYRLGQIGTGTFTHDLNVCWAKARGKPNPLLKIGETDHGNRDGEELMALRDVSFTVQQGEVLGIIGKNGAGKSTLLKILSRVTAPTSGRIRVKGRIASLLEVGTGFHPELTGRENIYLNGAILGMTRQEVTRKFEEIVDFAGVEKFIDTPVKRYSSGMYVRLAFAVAAHLEPEILIVDEVLAVGDAEFQKKCLGKMGDVAKQGRTVLFVSHNMAAVQNLCRLSMLIEKGQVKFIDVSDVVVAEYLNQFDTVSAGELSEVSYNRSGNGSIRFVGWSVVDERLGQGYQVGCNHACHFQISYSLKTEIRHNVSVALVIKDHFGQPLITGATEFKNSNFSDIPAEGKFICDFPHLPLIPGNYKVHLWCSINGEVADVIRDAGTLTIVPSDVFNTGRLPENKHGFFIADHSWDVERVLG
jgi:lipopolysaccharide transport system ATP-binding protein